MVLVPDKPTTTLVYHKLNSAIERGTKPDALGWKPCHWTRTLKAAIVNARRGILHTFGDSRKRNTVCGACTPRRGGRALAASDSLPRMHDGGPDGTVIPYTLTQLRDARRQAAATPHAARMATRPLHGPVWAP